MPGFRQVAAELQRSLGDVATDTLTVTRRGAPEVADGVLDIGAVIDRVARLFALSEGREGLAFR